MDKSSEALRARLDKIDASYRKKRLINFVLFAAFLSVLSGLYLAYHSVNEYREIAHLTQVEVAEARVRTASAREEIIRLENEKTALSLELSQLTSERTEFVSASQEVAVHEAVQAAINPTEDKPLKLQRCLTSALVGQI